MDVWMITVAVLRRWYVFLPLLLVTGFAAYKVGEGVDPQYEVTTTAILVPGAEEVVASPYGGISDTAQVLAIVLDDVATRDEFAARDLVSDYEFRARSQSRIMDLTVISDTPELGLATSEAVIEEAEEQLVQRQEAVDIPEAAQIGLQVLQAPSVTDVVTDGKLRNMAIVGLVGAALSLLVALTFDDLVGLMKRWRRRPHEEQEAARLPLRSTLEGGDTQASPADLEGPVSSRTRGDSGSVRTDGRT